ncbi:HNH endonuclease signature motif containing protein [uncultured Maritimibacter sp.]|uniref:HNH endonuclease n=1 Tax=uncultured Maritimibacter sp. TaxID=991866 RepID=UPI0025982BBD|nr:HNH endonuclease signature motif containing protein [uncultured Maritimibacter sp.]
MARPSVPINIKRRLYEESGYRCAIPTCRATSALEMEHIEPWAEAPKHEFENMIVLCANCHARVTKGEISKSAVRNYKRNLAITNGRYSVFEMRFVQMFMDAGFADEPNANVTIPQSDFLHIKGLADDGLVRTEPLREFARNTDLDSSLMVVWLTEAGRTFVKNYSIGKEITS